MKEKSGVIETEMQKASGKTDAIGKYTENVYNEQEKQSEYTKNVYKDADEAENDGAARKCAEEGRTAVYSETVYNEREKQKEYTESEYRKASEAEKDGAGRDKAAETADGANKPYAAEKPSKTLQTESVYNEPEKQKEYTENEYDKGADNAEELPAETPQYRRADWGERVERFLGDYPTARRFASAIGEELLADKALASGRHCLEAALGRVLAKAYAAPDEIIRDGAFREEYVYGNEEIRSVIVDRYLSDLKERRPPAAIGGGGKLLLTPPDRPRNIEEAGKIIKRMLNERRI